MNKTEKLVVTATLENMYSSSEKTWVTGDIKAWAKFGRKLDTSVKDGCHTLMKLIESNAGNEEVIKNTLLFLEKHDYLDDEVSDILTGMKQRKFTGD